MSILRKLRECTEPLTVKRVADLLDVSEATIQRWVRNREIPAIRIADTIRFDPGTLADWLERFSAPASGTGSQPSEPNTNGCKQGKFEISLSREEAKQEERR